MDCFKAIGGDLMALKMTVCNLSKLSPMALKPAPTLSIYILLTGVQCAACPAWCLWLYNFSNSVQPIWAEQEISWLLLPSLVTRLYRCTDMLAKAEYWLCMTQSMHTTELDPAYVLLSWWYSICCSSPPCRTMHIKTHFPAPVALKLSGRFWNGLNGFKTVQTALNPSGWF